MPFGSIFGAVFYGLVCPFLALQFLAFPGAWPPARPTGLALAVLGVTVALGLLRRHAWARWGGALGAVPLALTVTVVALRAVRGPLTAFLGFAVALLLVLLAAGITTLLLLLRRTGDPRFAQPQAPAALPEMAPVPPTRRRGVGLATTAIVAAVAFLGSAVWALATAAPEGFGAAWKPARVEWLDFGPALEQARQSGKYVVVDFFADWCMPCHQMDRVTFRHPEVARMLNEDVIAVRVDSEETEQRHGYSGLGLAEQYQVLTYPTIALLDADGKLLARRSGYLGPRRFLEWLQEAIELAEEKGDMLLFLEKGTEPIRDAAGRPRAAAADPHGASA